ncbi:MAG TPA: long-chain fatty acid--CoA ligase [Humisphaera sp.]|jgi:acyl-CoA synthetase (AMP-forming)/AMP-acid ligase II|nr:long-chain fatty acid--CoA ligase [Humisphaera sp.]
MFIDFLLDVFAQNAARTALIAANQSYTYQWLLDRISGRQQFLRENGIAAGAIVVLRADYSPDSIATFLALIEAGCVVIPVTTTAPAKFEDILQIGQAQWIITVGENDASVTRHALNAEHPIYQEVRRRGHPGLVLFSSGSTGASKGTVHDLVHLLAKYRKRRHDLRTLAFLLFDHIGGLDTLFYSLSNGSALVLVENRSPEAVCALIERHRVQVLPTAPTFLGMLVLTEAYRRHDLSSIKYVTYGAEMMPQATLDRCREIFPNATFLQKYGTTEVGTLRSKSREDGSLWVKIGGEGYQWRVVEGMLQIKADSAMLGYLNAPSPFTADGWFMTGDCVEVDGEFIRILGRKNDIINVGGQKVYPAEVENVIRQMPAVADVTVCGQPNAMLGNIVVARVRLRDAMDPAAFRVAMKTHVAARLDAYKVPVKVEFTTESQSNERFKKIRRQDADAAQSENRS